MIDLSSAESRPPVAATTEARLDRRQEPELPACLPPVCRGPSTWCLPRGLEVEQLGSEGVLFINPLCHSTGPDWKTFCYMDSLGSAFP